MLQYPLTVDQTVQQFQRYQYELTALFELTASMITNLERLEEKLVFGKSIYLDSQCLELIRKRIFELKGDPEVLICQSEEFKALQFNMLHLPPNQLFSAIIAFRKQLLIQLNTHKGLTSPVWDEASLDLIESIEFNQEKQIKKLQELISIEDSFVVQDWVSRIAGIQERGTSIIINSPVGLIAPEPEIPKRDERFKIVSADEIVKPEDKLEALKLSYHSVAFCIEIVAVELISRLIVDYPEMPFEFRRDLARQCYDECCHTTALTTFLERAGGTIGEFPVHINVWNYYQMGESLTERITIQQIVQEGHALDFNVFQTAFHRARSESLEAALNDYAGADELNHVRYGVKWLNYLLESEEEVLQVIDNVYQKLRERSFSPKHKVRRKERRIAWMTDPQIDRAKQAVDDALQEISIR